MENNVHTIEKETLLFCINESVYAQHITKGKTYTVQELKDEQVRIQTDGGKLAWFPVSCFAMEKPPIIVAIRIDDQIADPENDCVEVTVEFSNGEKRWTTFTTPNYLTVLLESNNYLFLPKFVFLKTLNEETIRETVVSLDKQNEFIGVSIAYMD